MEISGVSYGAAGYLKSQTQKAKNETCGQVKNETCEQVKKFDNIISVKEAMSLEEYKNYFTKQLVQQNHMISRFYSSFILSQYIEKIY